MRNCGELVEEFAPGGILQRWVGGFILMEFLTDLYTHEHIHVYSKCFMMIPLNFSTRKKDRRQHRQKLPEISPTNDVKLETR